MKKEALEDYIKEKIYEAKRGCYRSMNRSSSSRYVGREEELKKLAIWFDIEIEDYEYSPWMKEYNEGRMFGDIKTTKNNYEKRNHKRKS